jgi:hypothetical protein
MKPRRFLCFGTGLYFGGGIPFIWCFRIMASLMSRFPLRLLAGGEAVAFAVQCAPMAQLCKGAPWRRSKAPRCAMKRKIAAGANGYLKIPINKPLYSNDIASEHYESGSDPPTRTQLRCSARKSPSVRSRMRRSLIGVPSNSKSLRSFAKGSLAILIWYLIERACFSLTSACNRSPTMHSFKVGSDGCCPLAGLVLNDSTLYGTTQGGGATFGGTVFKLK